MAPVPWEHLYSKRNVGLNIEKKEKRHNKLINQRIAVFAQKKKNYTADLMMYLHCYN